MKLPERWTKLRYHPVQHALWTDNVRFKFAACGRSSGKTELAKRRLIMALMEHIPGCPKPLYFAAGPTYNQQKRVWWNDLIDLCPKEWIANISLSELFIQTIFGSTLFLVGLDTPMRVEGVQYCGGVIDESSDIRPGTFSLSIRPALSFYEGWCWRIGVPKRFGIGAAEYRQGWEQARNGNLPDAKSYWWKSSDILTPSEIDSAKMELSPEDFKEQYEAEWLSLGGVLFSSFGQHTIGETNYDPSLPIYVGCDFNMDPMCWVLAHKIGTRLHVFDELFLRDVNTQNALTLLWNKYREHKSGWVFTGDASSKSRQTSASSTDYALIYNDERFIDKQIGIGDSNPSIRDRVAATNRQLKDAHETVSLTVGPQCGRLIEDLRLRASFDSIDDIGHMSDALGYLVWALWPLSPELQTGDGRVIIGRSKRK